jgi:hypothetical protein
MQVLAKPVNPACPESRTGLTLPGSTTLNPGDTATCPERPQPDGHEVTTLGLPHAQATHIATFVAERPEHAPAPASIIELALTLRPVRTEAPRFCVVELSASYSNTASQVVALFNRVSDAVRQTSSDHVAA